MSTKAEKLKEIAAQKKALAEEQKALREELDAGKEERKAARKQQAEARRQVRELKAELREASAAIYNLFSEGSSEEISELADRITETGTALAGSVRSFAEAAAEIEEL